MGVVYSAYDTVLERTVAIKVVGDRVLADKPARDLLLHEARAASALNHPNICTIHQVGDSDGEAYIVMEQVEGPPVSSLLGTGGLLPDLVIRYGMQIADALDHAHQHGVIHRDLKSTNALVTPEGRVKVLDFGLATRLRDAELQEAVSSIVPLTESRTIVGTLPYLAPELLRGEPADALTDIWALGVLLYEMASGSHPFYGRTAFELSSAILRDAPAPLPTSVPSGLAAVILRCLEKPPVDRYHQAAEVRADLQLLGQNSGTVRPSVPVQAKPVDPEPRQRTRLRVRMAAWTAGIVAALLIALLVFRWLAPVPLPRVLRTTQLTRWGHADGWGGVTSDGARIFYLARDADHWNLMQVPVSGGESQRFPSPFRNTVIMDISPDRSEFLVAPFSARTGNLEFWTMPVVGGSARRLGDLTGDGPGAFSPDGQKIAYTKANGLYVCARNGSGSQRLVSLPDSDSGVVWSPDGEVLRFSEESQKDESSSLWEISADGSNLHPLLPGWHQPAHECCGRWSSDGRYYFFLSTKGDPLGAGYSVWARREKTGSLLWSKPSPPVQLTAGSTEFRAISPSKDGRQLLTLAGTDINELLWPTSDKKQFLPMRQLPEVAAVNVSPKGNWLALILRGWLLWRSRPDGSERIQLAADFPGAIDSPRWSPDETGIVFEGRQAGRAWNIYLVHADGGATEALLPNDEIHKSPDWLPDSESVVYFTPPSAPGTKVDSGIFVLNLKTRKTTKLPGSEGLQEPRSAFGGRYLAALTEDQTKVMLFDFATQKWTEIAGSGKLFFHLESTRDLKYLYFQDLLEPGQPLYRVRAGASKPERVMSFESVLQTGVIRCAFAGLTADGSPIVLANRGGTDVYALDLDLP